MMESIVPWQSKRATVKYGLMKRTFLCCTLLLCMVCSARSGALSHFFPYQIQKKTLKNGMDVIVIETPEFKDVLSYNTLVLAGARNEMDKGKSGLAHLFEHILFRHRWNEEPNGYDRSINSMGAFNNAWTNFDVTYYHPLTFTSNLKVRADRPSLPQLEADRFKNLDFTVAIFKTEAGAVLGEYRRMASDPGLRMVERLLALAFPNHSYGHTTIGYLEDVEDMGNEYQAALDFYQTYYRPNNVILIVSGAVKADEVFPMVEDLYGDWPPGDPPVIPEGGAVGGSRQEHIEWPANVPPRVSYTYRMPAFTPSSKQGAVGQLLPELLAGETAPLYKKLRYDKKTANRLSLVSSRYESFNARLLELEVTLFKEQYAQKGEAYFSDVILDIRTAFENLKQFSQMPGCERTLSELKSKFRYDLLAVLNSPSNIARQFAWYYRFERDPKVFETLVSAVGSLRPTDIDAFAEAHFTETDCVVITMAKGKR